MTRSWNIPLQWTLATAAALALATLVIEMLFVAALGFLLLPPIPLADAAVGFPVLDDGAR